jgi:hypothetical protein
MMAEACRYVVTDSDLDLSRVPTDLLDLMNDGLDKYPQIIKAGLSLELDDLPEDGLLTEKVRRWEAAFWRDRLDDQFWLANVDTTFALHRAGTIWTGVAHALRTDRPYTARHLPWYDPDTPEEIYFREHCRPKWSTWIRVVGELRVNGSAATVCAKVPRSREVP